MPEQKTIRDLTNNLEETLEITNVCLKMMQDEMVSNANFKGRMEQAITNIEDRLDTIYSLVASGTQHSLVDRVNKLEFHVNTLQDTYKEDKEKGNRVAERGWSFVIQNGISILTWLALAIWSIFQIFVKKT